mgnify:CR=1 FL=1
MHSTQTAQNVSPSGDQPLRTCATPYPLLTFPIASLVRAGIRIKGSTNTSNATPGVLSTAGLNTNTSTSSSRIVQIDLTNSTDKHVLPVTSLHPKQNLHSNLTLNMTPNANMRLQELFHWQQQRAFEVKYQSMHATREAGEVQPLLDLPLTAGLLTKNNCSDISNTKVSTTATSTVVGDIDIQVTSSNCAPVIESTPSEHEEAISLNHVSQQDATWVSSECNSGEGVVDTNGSTSTILCQDNTAEIAHLRKEPSVASSSINAQKTSSELCPNGATKEPSNEKNSSNDSFCTDIENPKDSKTQPESHIETKKLPPVPLKAN